MSEAEFVFHSSFAFFTIQLNPFCVYVRPKVVMRRYFVAGLLVHPVVLGQILVLQICLEVKQVSYLKQWYVLSNLRKKRKLKEWVRYFLKFTGSNGKFEDFALEC